MTTEHMMIIEKEVLKWLDPPRELDDAIESLGANISSKVRRLTDKVFNSKRRSYRDALLIQLSYGILSTKDIDLTVRHSGARGVAGHLGKFLKSKHIKAVNDAYQNIGKNSTILTRGNFAEFDDFLNWASSSQRTKDDLKVVFSYVCARLAGTARAILPYPELILAKLTFGVVSNLFYDLMMQGSQGAYEQFTVAALFDALLTQDGNSGLRVETKSLNASDKSSRTAGDVQILHGNRLYEAYEVTANSWTEKMEGAKETIKTHDLQRTHIVARADYNEKKAILSELLPLREDISVIDLDAFISMMLSTLTKQFRANALSKLYDYLDRYQPDVDKVNTYVKTLKKHGMTVESSS